MSIPELDKETFKKIIAEKQLNVIVFYRSECHVCDMYFEELDKRNFQEYSKVNINTDIIYYKSELGVWMVPRTRIYMNNGIIWEMGGILYDKQYKELISVLTKGIIE